MKKNFTITECEYEITLVKDSCNQFMRLTSALACQMKINGLDNKVEVDFKTCNVRCKMQVE